MEYRKLNETFLSTSDFVKNDAFKIYQNTATDFIEFNGDLSTYSKANIYSLDEKLIRKSALKSGKIHVADLSPSSYFIELSGNKTHSKSVKFIKK